MSKTVRRSGLVALAVLPALFVSTSADAYCGNTVQTGSYSHCIQVISRPLPVYEADGDGLICKFRVGRKFWGPRSAIRGGGRTWHGVRLTGIGAGIFQERRNGRRTVRGC